MIVLRNDPASQECQGSIHPGHPIQDQIPRHIHVAVPILSVQGVVFSDAALPLGQQVDSEPPRPAHVAVGLTLMADAYQN